MLHTPHRTSRRRLQGGLAAALTAWLVASPFADVAHAEATVVPLGTALPFSVLAGSTITNTGTTVVNRSIGVHPGTAITGANTMVIGGEVHAGDAVARSAKSDLTTAYNNAAGQSPRIAADEELGGETLVGGVYRRPAAMALTGTLTLDGQNDPDSVWVFQAGSTLTTGSGSSVVLIRGADPCNVFWQVGSSATIGTGTRFVGTVMADQSIALQTDARLRGRALARIGAVTLDTNVITSPACRDSVDTDDDDGGDGGGGGGDDGGGNGGGDNGGGNNGGGNDNGGGDNGGNGGGNDGGGGSGGSGGDDDDGGGDDGGGGGSDGSSDGSQIDQPPSGGVPTGDASGVGTDGGVPGVLLGVAAALVAGLGLIGIGATRRPRRS